MDINSVDLDGNEVRLTIKEPDAECLAKAQIVYLKSFREALDNGALLRKALDKHLKSQNIWSDEDQEESDKINNRIIELEYILNKGGIKKQEAYEYAIELKKLRYKFRDLISERLEHDALTAEGQADNRKFNYLVYACVFDYVSQTPKFSSLEEYEQSIEPYAFDAASKLSNILYGLDEDHDSKLTENVFLKRFNFVDDNYRLINNEGKLIDEYGNIVDELGRKVDSDGNLLVNNRSVVETDVSEVDFLE